MKQVFPALLLSILFLFPFQSRSQSLAQVSGSIRGPESEPVMFSTVVLLNQDSAYVKADVSKEDGTFVLTQLKPGTYRIYVQNVEYQSHLSDYFTLNGGDQVAMAPVRMEKSVTQLSEVVVTWKKAVVEIHPDKMVFNVEGNVNAAGSNGLELLNKAPGVFLDPDNNIIVQGKSGVRIFINGRPSRLSGSDLTSMLQSMQSDNIESIEIITNPSARYEAEGNAGIINIRLKKNIDSGFNGSALANYSLGDYSRNSTGLTLNYRKGKVNTYGDITRFDNDFQSDFVDIKEQSGYLLDQVALGLDRFTGYNFSAGIDYTINAKHSLSLVGRGIMSDGKSVMNSTTGIGDPAGASSDQLLISGSATDFDSENFNYNLNYQFIPSKTANLNIDLSLGDYDAASATDQPNRYLDPAGTTTLSEANSSFNTNTGIGLWSAKVDFEKSYKKTTFSTGGKFSYINTDNVFAFYNIENGQPNLDINRSNNFTYLEKVSALYAIVNSNLTPKLTLNAGLRMEHTASEGRLKGELTIENSDVVRDYTNYFPNIGLSYNDKKNTAWSVSVGRRITRPNYQDLNPFESKLSELAFFKGNPFLQPQYVMNYQLSYAYKQKLIVSNTYSVTTDFFAAILQIVDDKRTFLTPRNMQKSINNGLTVSYPMSILKWWEVTGFVNYNYSIYKGDIEGTVIDLTANIYNIRIQNNVTIAKNLVTELTYFYNSPLIWRGSLKIDDFSGLNFGIRREFFDGRLQVRVTGSDVLNRNSDFHYHGNYGGLNINGVRSVDNRRYGAGATFKFGNEKLKAARRRKSALDDELNRISSGN